MSNTSLRAGASNRKRHRVIHTALEVDDESDSSSEEEIPNTMVIPKLCLNDVTIKNKQDLKGNPPLVCEQPKKKPPPKTPKYFLPRKPPSNKKPINYVCPAADTVAINWSDSSDDDVCEENCACASNPKFKHFRPKLYDFKLDDYDSVKDMLILNENKYSDNIMIRCPEFAFLLDHVIAVIWYFYRDWDNWNMFNIPQLEWAIKFLAGISANNKSAVFVDIETMYNHLTELLFINYSEVDSCVITPCKVEKKKERKKKPPPSPKPDDDLPVTLKSLFYRAPQFTKHLALKKPSCGTSKRDTCQLDKNANESIKLMNEQLEKLKKFELRYMKSLAQDNELQEIIDGIKVHADTLIRAREEMQCLMKMK